MIDFQRINLRFLKKKGKPNGVNISVKNLLAQLLECDPIIT